MPLMRSDTSCELVFLMSSSEICCGTMRMEQDGEEPDLSQAIDKLPADARRIFVLHDVEGFKHEEIAEIFGITAGGSKARLRRARVLLKEALGR